MAPPGVAGGLVNSSPSSDISFQGDGQYQSVGNSRLSSSFGNSSNPIQGAGRSHKNPVSGDASNTFLDGAASSGPSPGASSLVTDANSGLSGGPHLQRSASFNTESYMRLPASPMSFSSNNISISGSSVMDGSCVLQQNSNQDTSSQQVSQQLQQQGASGATSLPTSRMGHFSIPTGSQVPGSFLQDPDIISQLQKKPRLDIKQEDIMHQQVMQQLLHQQDSLQLQTHNPELQALIQQHRLRQQQNQFLQSMPPARAHLLEQQQQQQQLQLRQQLQQQGMQSVSFRKRPYDNGGVCHRRIMQYLYHQRQRPPENPIAYWRKFVAEYYSPRAKKRWCLSLYDNVGHPSLGVFPQATKGAWQCDICGSKAGRGFEATFEVLPRLNEIKFGSGVTDELLFVDLPQESRSGTGLMMLDYGRAVQESVYEQLRVVREGHLRVIFSPDLKILSWEFCARRHEELLPRGLVAPQVNQLLQVAQKYQSAIADRGSDGISQEDLLTNSNKVVTALRQLARTLESHSLNDLGFSKRYVRCLQISEVVSSMKDLMDFCRDNKAGPIEGLKNYPRHSTAAKLQMHDMEQLATFQNMPTDRSTLNKVMTQHPGLNSHTSNNHHTVNRGALNGSAQAAFAPSNYQNLLTKQNSMNSNSSSFQPEASSSFSFNNSYQNPSSPVQGPSSHQRSMNGYEMHQQSHLQSHQGSQTIQQQMMQQLLQDMNNNNSGSNNTTNSSSNTTTTTNNNNISGGGMQNVMARDGISYGSNASAGLISGAGSGGGGPTPSSSHSLKAASNTDYSAVGGNNGFNQKAPDLPQNFQWGNTTTTTTNNNNISGGGMQNVMARDGISYGSNASAGLISEAGSGGGGPTPSSSHSLKAASNTDYSAVGGNNGFNQKAPDLPQDFQWGNTTTTTTNNNISGGGMQNVMARDGISYGSNASAGLISGAGSGGGGPTPSSSHSLKAASNTDYSAVGGNNGFNQKAPDLPQDFQWGNTTNNNISGGGMQNVMARDGISYGSNASAGLISGAGSGGGGPTPSSSHSLKAASNTEYSAVGGNNGFNQKAPDLPQDFQWGNTTNNNINGGGMQNVMARDGISYGSNASAGLISGAGSGGGGPTPSSSHSLKAASNTDYSAVGGNNGFNQKAPDLPQDFLLSDDEIDGFFDSDFDINMGF